MNDLRFALRSLRASPGFTTVAILTLALGIGATTAVFSIVNGVLLQPLPFHDQDRLFMVAEQSRSGSIRPLSYPTFLDWRDQTSAVADIAFVRGERQRVTTADGVQSILASFVSPGFFTTLGERPLLGRLFTPTEERSGMHVAVLSYRLWQSILGGDPRVVGRPMDLTAGVFTVVGILPPDVTYPPWAAAQVYMPIETIAPSDPAVSQRGFHADSRVIARLKPGVTAHVAAAKLGTVAQREAASYPAFNADWTSAWLLPVADEILGNAPRQLAVLLAAVGLVLLIACVNVVNLSLARAGARARELAIRAAIGAGRARLVRQLLAETVLLAAAGTALGVLAATWGIDLVKRGAGAVLPRIQTVSIDQSVLAFAIGIMVLSVIATGLVPAFHAARTDVTNSLREGTGRSGTSVRLRRLRGMLVAAEVALAVVVVVGAGLLVKSLWRLRAVDPGFDPRGLVTFSMWPPPSEQDNPAKLAALYERVEQTVRGLPGVTHVALTNFMPLSGASLPSPVAIPGRVPDPLHDPQVIFRTVSPGYFQTMRIPLRAGRAFTDADLAGGTAVLVNEAFVQAFWRGEDPIGRAVVLHKAAQGRPDFGEPLPGTVVGVVSDVHHFALAIPPGPEVYVPFTRNVWGHMVLVARAPSAPERLAATLRRIVRRAAPELPVTLPGGTPAVDTIDLGAGLTSQRFDAALLGAFAASALALAAIGIYGLLAYSLTQRRREIAIRAALGAHRGEILRLVVGDGMRPVLAGAAAGVVAALALTRVLRALLFGVGPRDPTTVGAVVGLLVLVALAACYLPARRAAQVDPMETLRYE